MVFLNLIEIYFWKYMKYLYSKFKTMFSTYELDLTLFLNCTLFSIHMQ